MTDKELIKQEIERLKHTWNAYDRSRFMLLLEIEDFIASLPEEPVSEDLRTAAIENLESVQGKSFNSTSEEQCFRVYAFEAGAKWQKQQMIEKACELYRKELVALNNLLVAYDKEAFANLIMIDDSVVDFRNTLKKAMKGE